MHTANKILKINLNILLIIFSINDNKQTIKNALVMHPYLNDVHLFCLRIY